MGCGASEGKDEDSSKSTKEIDVKFKHLNVKSLDQFFKEVTALIEAFKDAAQPYKEARDAFYEATKFYEVPGASKNFPLFYLTSFNIQNLSMSLLVYSLLSPLFQMYDYLILDKI